MISRFPVSGSGVPFVGRVFGARETTRFTLARELILEDFELDGVDVTEERC